VALPENLIRIFGLLGAVGALGVLVLLLRWTYGTQRSNPSPPSGDGYGLLEEVSRVPSAEAATVLRSRLAENGVRATVSAVRAEEGGGYRLLVFPDDHAAAKIVLGQHYLE
jgi:hypothetical protein